MAPDSCTLSNGQRGDCNVLGTEVIPLLTALQREDLFLATYERRAGMGEAGYASHWFCARRCDAAIGCRGFSFYENPLDVLRSKGEDSDHLGARKLHCVYFGTAPTEAQPSTAVARGKCFVKVNTTASTRQTACSPSHVVTLNPTGTEMSGTAKGSTVAAPADLPGVASPRAQAVVLAVDVPPQFKLSLTSEAGLFGDDPDEEPTRQSRFEVRAGTTCPGETLIYGDEFPKFDKFGRSSVPEGQSTGLQYTFENFEKQSVRCFVVVRGTKTKAGRKVAAGKYSIDWRLHEQPGVEFSYDRSASFILSDRTTVSPGVSAATSLQTANGMPTGLETITVIDGPGDPRSGFHTCAQILVGDLASGSLRMLDDKLVESCHLRTCGSIDPESEGDDVSALPPPTVSNMSRGFHIVPGLAGGNTVTIKQCDYQDYPLRAWNQSQHALTVRDFKTFTLYAREYYSSRSQGWNQNELWDPGTQCASVVNEEDPNMALLSSADDDITACARTHSVWRGSRGRLISGSAEIATVASSAGWWTYAHGQTCVQMSGNHTTYDSTATAGVACLQLGQACGGVLGHFSTIKAESPEFALCEALTPTSALSPDSDSFVWVAGTLGDGPARCAAFAACSSCTAAVGCVWVRTNTTLGLEGPGTCQTLRAPYIESRCDAAEATGVNKGGNQCPSGRFTDKHAKLPKEVKDVWTHNYTCASLRAAEPSNVAPTQCAPGYYNTTMGKIRCFGLDNTQETHAATSSFCEDIVSEQTCVLNPACTWGTEPSQVCSSREAGERRHAEWEQFGTCDFDEPIDTSKDEPMCRTAVEDECQPCPPCVDCTIMPGTPLLKRGYMLPMRTHVGVRFMSDESPPGAAGKALDKLAFRCPSEGSCLGEAFFPPPMNKRTPARCAPGNSGPLCTLCLPGNYRVNPASPCKECTMLLKLGFISALAGVGLAVLVWVKVFANLIDVTRIFHWWTNTSAQANLKILLGLAQVISSAPVALDMEFPDVFRLVLEFLKLFSMSFTNLVVTECFSVLSGLYATTISRCVVIPTIIFGGMFLRFHTLRRGILNALAADNEPDQASIEELKAGNAEDDHTKPASEEVSTIEERIKVRTEEATVLINKLRFSSSSFAMLVLLFMYPMVSQMLFRLWPSVCRELINAETDGWAAESWHADDYRVDCTVGKHRIMMALSFVLIAAIPLCVPFFFFHAFVGIMHAKSSESAHRLRGTILNRMTTASLRTDVLNRRAGNTVAASTQTQTSNASTQTNEISSNYRKLKAHFSFMVSDYKPQYYYWEVLVMLEKMLLTAAIGVVRRGTGEQLVLATLISMMFMALHIRCWPYVLEISNYIKLGVELNIMMIYIVSLALRGDSSPASVNMYGWILVTITVGLTPLSMLYAFFSIETKVDASNADPSMVDSEDGDWVTVLDDNGNVLLAPDHEHHKSRRDLNSNVDTFKATKLQPKIFMCCAKVSLTAGVELPSTAIISLRPGQRFRAVEEWHCPETGAVRCRGTLMFDRVDQSASVTGWNMWCRVTLLAIEHWHLLHVALNVSVYVLRKGLPEQYLPADHEWLCEYVVYISTILLIMQGIARRMKMPQVLVVYTFILHVFIVMSIFNAVYWYVVDQGVGIDGQDIQNTLTTQTSGIFLVILALAERSCLAVYVGRVVASDRCLHATHGSFEALPPSRWGPKQCREWLEASFVFLRDEPRLADFEITGPELLAMDVSTLRERLLPDSSSQRRKMMTLIKLLKEEETLGTMLSLVGVREGHPVNERWPLAQEKKMNKLLVIHAVVLVLMLWQGVLATDTAFVNGWPANTGGPRPVAATFGSIAAIVTGFFFFVVYKAVREQDPQLFAVVLLYKRPYLLAVTLCLVIIPGICIFGTEVDGASKGIGVKETNAIINRLYFTIICAGALLGTVAATTSLYEEMIDATVKIRADVKRVQSHLRMAFAWFSGIFLFFAILRISFMIDGNGLSYTVLTNSYKLFDAVLIACVLGVVYAGLGLVCLQHPRPSFVSLHGLIHTVCLIAFEASTLGLTVMVVFGAMGVPVVGANQLVKSDGRFSLIFWWLAAAISGGILVRGAVEHSIDPTPAQYRASPKWKARLARLLTFYFCFWFPFIMWWPMVAGVNVMQFDPSNFKDDGIEILFSCCFATGVESFFFIIGSMAVYNKLPLFPALQALAGFGATLFFVPWGLMHFTFIVGCIYNAAIRYPSCTWDGCTVSWISFSGWCMFAFLTCVQVIIVGAFFVSMHMNGSIQGFIESVVSLFERETVEPIQDKEAQDESTSTDEGDNMRFQNPVHEQGSNLGKYAAASIAGAVVAHDVFSNAQSFGE